MSECEFCGEVGHDYTVHPEAVADVAAWKAHERAESEHYTEEF